MTNDLALHVIALKEVAERRPVPALWAKAFADAGGDPNRARTRYMMLRVADLSLRRKDAAQMQDPVAAATAPPVLAKGGGSGTPPVARADVTGHRIRARQMTFALWGTAVGLLAFASTTQLLSTTNLNRFVAPWAGSAGDWLNPNAREVRDTNLAATIPDPGNAPAQTSIGDRFYGGRGQPRDYAAAATWYRKAAERGYAKAQVDLAVMYKFGEGVARNYAQSAAWFRKAADQGNAEAQVNLGLLYQFGQGVAQDDAQSAAWFRRAADQGNTRGLDYLAALYEAGQGVPQNDVEALKLWNLALARTPAWETELAGETIKNRDRIAAKMTPAQIIDAQRLAREGTPR